MIYDESKFPNIFNKYFSSVGHNLASKMPNSQIPFTNYLPKINNTGSFQFKYKLYLKVAKIDCYKHSFFVRIVSKWNNLPSEIVKSNSLQQFTNRLRKLMDMYRSR
jgi:hypothetical protein